MVPGKHTRNSLISIGLMVTFLFTAIVLPMVSSTYPDGEVKAQVLKSSNDYSKSNPRLPLAEKETEEEESVSKKIQNASTGLAINWVEQSYPSSNPVRLIAIGSDCFIATNVPRYLAKRSLLI